MCKRSRYSRASQNADFGDKKIIVFWKQCIVSYNIGIHKNCVSVSFCIHFIL